MFIFNNFLYLVIKIEKNLFIFQIGKYGVLT